MDFLDITGVSYQLGAADEVMKVKLGGGGPPRRGLDHADSSGMKVGSAGSGDTQAGDRKVSEGVKGSGRCLEGVCLKQAGQKGSDEAEKRWGAGRDLGGQDILEGTEAERELYQDPLTYPGDVLRGRPEDGPGAWVWCVLMMPLRGSGQTAGS